MLSTHLWSVVHIHKNLANVHFNIEREFSFSFCYTNIYPSTSHILIYTLLLHIFCYTDIYPSTSHILLYWYIPFYFTYTDIYTSTSHILLYWYIPFYFTYLFYKTFWAVELIIEQYNCSFYKPRCLRSKVLNT